MISFNIKILIMVLDPVTLLPEVMRIVTLILFWISDVQKIHSCSKEKVEFQFSGGLPAAVFD